ncbi:membrane protein [Sphaerisporangium siamense]|uniref:Putative metalloprotease n=1 Tax=Sphaerisporangium siamense TaxID=795645 RepID=A0A7W7G8T4_9ACTN|nr:neutral zinc metallopeptidase [Sphaerisporangium siamense]MBB4699849.1 putative metalloprotease [Sphaerisporangium siamense]GII84831.1 membrane protein [Sphaerisporangium siamense]
MDFRDDVDLDASQVENRGGGGGLRGGGLAIGGGAVGVIALLAALLFGVNPGEILGGGGDSTGAQPASDLTSECRKGSDADQSENCRVVGVVNSIQAYWKDAFDQAGRSSYTSAKTVLFSQAVGTGCGQATSQVGPFYCPADKRVYLDLTFFDELQSKFGAKGGPFAQAYVIAHEYGHHVQDLLGTMERVGEDRQGPESGSVRLELQADCYAGIWAKNAVDTGFYEKPFTDTDIQEALDAAAAVGDDRIQEKAQGRVNPEGFTHGTADQRMKWFGTGYKSGDPGACDTFSGGI